MHEMALCEGIVQCLEEEARRQHFRRVRRVHLSVGALATVELDALRFCYEVVARGGIADASTLIVERVPGTAWCLQCCAAIELEDRLAPCPTCGSARVQVTGGDDMRITELEVE